MPCVLLRIDDFLFIAHEQKHHAILFNARINVSATTFRILLCELLLLALFNAVHISRDADSHAVRAPPGEDEDVQRLAGGRRQLRAAGVRPDGQLYRPLSRVLPAPHHALRPVARRHVQDGRPR